MKRMLVAMMFVSGMGYAAKPADVDPRDISYFTHPRHTSQILGLMDSQDHHNVYIVRPGLNNSSWIKKNDIFYNISQVEQQESNLVYIEISTLSTLDQLPDFCRVEQAISNSLALSRCKTQILPRRDERNYKFMGIPQENTALIVPSETAGLWTILRFGHNNSGQDKIWKKSNEIFTEVTNRDLFEQAFIYNTTFSLNTMLPDAIQVDPTLLKKYSEYGDQNYKVYDARLYTSIANTQIAFSIPVHLTIIQKTLVVVMAGIIAWYGIPKITKAIKNKDTEQTT